MGKGPIPPVIIIGMHRSGTSMLTRTLQGLGFFMGRGTTRNEECRFTNALNAWLFRQASATWERPEGVDALLDHAQVRSLITDYMSGVTAGLASWNYLGPSRWLRYRSMHQQKSAWGWKDPRNTFTLPFWLEVFPQARVLHITRHGVDVAQSLRARHYRAYRAAAERYQRHRPWYINNPLAPKRRGFAQNAAVASLDYALGLWVAYTRRAQSQVHALGAARALEVRYEDLLTEPHRYLPEIARFCGVKIDDDRLPDRESERFRPERVFAYRRDEQLAEFARNHSITLERLGYSA